jgi:CHASE1-domain containing sensor protein
MNSDVDDHFKNTKQVFEELSLEKYSDEDCRITQYVCSLVSTRAAFLASAGKIEIQKFTVNQLLFAATLFRDSSMKNWLVASNFRDQAVFIHTKLHITISS